MKADQNTEAAVKDVLLKFAEYYEKRDPQGLLSCFVSDQDLVLYGTGKDEKRIGSDQVKVQAERDWSQTDSAAFNFTWMSVSASGSVAWVAADGEINIGAGKEDFKLFIRATFVLENRDGKWLIVQSHFSVPNSSQEEGESF